MAEKKKQTKGLKKPKKLAATKPLARRRVQTALVVVGPARGRRQKVYARGLEGVPPDDRVLLPGRKALRRRHWWGAPV